MNFVERRAPTVALAARTTANRVLREAGGGPPRWATASQMYHVQREYPAATGAVFQSKPLWRASPGDHLVRSDHAT